MRVLNQYILAIPIGPISAIVLGILLGILKLQSGLFGIPVACSSPALSHKLYRHDPECHFGELRNSKFEYSRSASSIPDITSGCHRYHASLSTEIFGEFRSEFVRISLLCMFIVISPPCVIHKAGKYSSKWLANPSRYSSLYHADSFAKIQKYSSLQRSLQKDRSTDLHRSLSANTGKLRP